MKHILLGGLIALLLTGCSKLNRENYDTPASEITSAEIFLRSEKQEP